MRTYYNSRIGNWRFVIDLDEKRFKLWHEKPPARRERRGKPCMTSAQWATTISLAEWEKQLQDAACGPTWDWRKVMSELEKEDECEP